MQADLATGKEKTGRELRRVAETIADLVYPPRCPICDRVTVPECVPCRRCAEAVRLAVEPVCKRCGKPLDDERTEFCLDCGKRRHAYCQGKAVFVYQGNIRQSMYRFKYANRREYAAYYAREAAALYQDWVFKNQIEVIVPVPMYRWKSGGADTIRPRHSRGRLAGNWGFLWTPGLCAVCATRCRRRS